MSDSEQHHQQQADEEHVPDLTVPDAQAEEVGGGEGISFPYGGLKVEYERQNPPGTL
jgi:hypothetical protein